MKCKNCGSEWHSAGSVLLCPFCRQDCTLPESEIMSRFALAEEIAPDAATEKAKAYQAVAEYGYAPAQYALGLAYEHGTGTVCSPARAAVWFRLAAEQGHADAAYHLALYLRDKYAGESGVDNAYFFLRVAAELGSPAACCLLGSCYDKGEGIAANPIRAAYWYTLAAGSGYFRAAYNLALLYHEGRGVRPNPAYEKYYAEIASNGGIRAADALIAKIDDHVFPEVPAPIEVKSRNEDRFELAYRAYTEGRFRLAALLFALAAKDGYPRARNYLGLCYERGEGVEKDPSAAFTWYELAAEGGYDMAYLNLGDCYRDGRGTEKNDSRAFACYLTAAQNGFARAQYVVGNCYFDASLVDRNIPEAMRWYEKAALQGDADAIERVNGLRADMTELYNRGVAAYENGAYSDAVKFYTVAAEFGHRGAQCNLGYCYQHGMGCEENKRYAVYYYRKAAEQESGVAEYNLASCYLHAEGGLTYDYGKAAELLRRAVSHGADQAATLLAEITARKKKKLARRVYSVSAAVLYRGEEEMQDALKFRMIAAEMGNARAMFALGCHYEFGFGLPMDEIRAAEWYRRAYRAGYKAGSRMKSTMLKMIKRPAGFRQKTAPVVPAAEAVAAQAAAETAGTEEMPL